MSLGQSAELAGYSKRAFMEILSSYNVSIFSESISDLENDMLNAKTIISDTSYNSHKGNLTQ